MLKDSQKVWLRVISVIAAGVWVVLGITNGWPSWAWLLLAALSLIAPFLTRLLLAEAVLRRARTRVPEEEPTLDVPPEPQPETPQPQSFHVNNVLLSSAREDYQFLFGCAVLWLPSQDTPVQPHTKPGALAANTILDEATRLAATIRPEDASRAQYQMMSMLGTPREDRTGRVHAWADQISLRLTDEDSKRLKRLAEVRKDEEVWEHERSYERNVRTYLGDDVLTSAGNALVWWLAGPRTAEKGRVQEAVQQIPNLRQLTQTTTGANDTTESSWTTPLSDSNHEFVTVTEPSAPAPFPQLPFPSPLPSDTNGQQPEPEPEAEPEPEPEAEAKAGLPLDQHVVGFLEQLPDTPERAFLARQLADHLREHGFNDAADTISRQFDRPTSAPPYEESSRRTEEAADRSATDEHHSDISTDETDTEDGAKTTSSNTSLDDDIDPGSASAGLGS